MPSRSRFILTVLALGALACGVVAAWWWFDADRLAFYTDDASIRTSAEDAPVRDILWRPPAPLRTVTGEPITGRDPIISADGDTLLLTQTSSLGDADLFVAGRMGDAWTQPRALVELNTIDNELAPALSADGQRLYFASDRPGGAGGLDVWMSERVGDRWGEPTPLALNTRHDETDPHPLVRDGIETLLFASNRPREVELQPEPATDFDLYEAALDGAQPTHLVALSSPANDVGPAISPAGDFVYFSSDREGGAGGADLYRARIGTDASFGEVRTLGASINTAADERDPSLALEGFAIQFAILDEDGPRLLRAVSREVYLARSTTRGDLLSLLPWILVALALVLALALLRRVVRDAQWQARIATLGLMAKCALVSLVVHAGLMALLAALQVPPTAGQPTGQTEGLQVALSSSAVRSSAAEQMRGSTAPAALAQASTDTPAAPTVLASASDASITFQPQRTTAPTGSPMQAAVTIRESSITASTSQASDASVPAMPKLEAPTPQIGLPEAQAAVAPETAEVGIGAPTLAEGPSIPQSSAVEVAAGSESVRIEAAESRVADAARFAPSTGVGEAAPTPSDATELQLAAASIDLPELDAPTLALALPTEGDVDAIVDEPGEAPLRMAEANARSVPAPITGDVALPLSEFDAAVATPEVEQAAMAEEPIEAAPVDDVRDPVLALDLPPARFEPPELRLPEAVAHRFELLGMVIDDQTEAALQGAQVRLDLEGTADLTDTSADDGTFLLGFDQIPDNAALTASLDGYTPSAINIAQRDLRAGRRFVVRLRKIDPFVIVMEDEPEVHHLGNDEFSGRINSQFQRRSEGLVLQMPFEMTEAHANLPLRGAELRLLVKGTQAPNPVRINGRQIATLAQSPNDGGFGEQVISIPSGVLKLGRNVLELESVARPGSDKDDYEFVNPRVVLLVDDDAAI